MNSKKYCLCNRT